MKQSGKHFVKSSKRDLLKLVTCLIENDALNHHDGRHYRHFLNCPCHSLCGGKLAGLCKWIDKHKKGIVTGRKAR